MLGLTFASKLDWGPYIISIAKTASKNIGALICSMKFFLLRLLYISINPPYAHVWNTVVTSGLVVHSLFWLKSLKRLNSYFVMRIWAPKPVYHFLKCPGYLAVLPTPFAMLLSPDDSISHKTNSHDFQKHSVVICNRSK